MNESVIYRNSGSRLMARWPSVKAIVLDALLHNSERACVHSGHEFFFPSMLGRHLYVVLEIMLDRSLPSSIMGNAYVSRDLSSFT